jgi:hypothetical protein
MCGQRKDRFIILLDSLILLSTSSRTKSKNEVENWSAKGSRYSGANAWRLSNVRTLLKLPCGYFLGKVRGEKGGGPLLAF